MKVVVDLGCLTRNGANSLETLAEEYSPEHIYGFDPSAHLVEGEYVIEPTQFLLRRRAAWVEDGTLLFHEDGSASRIGSYGHEVECFDFSAWLKNFHRTVHLIVKMDIEGAEVQVLEKMKADGTDALVDELLVEWHGQKVEDLRCPVREWWM